MLKQKLANSTVTIRSNIIFTTTNFKTPIHVLCAYMYLCYGSCAETKGGYNWVVLANVFDIEVMLNILRLDRLKCICISVIFQVILLHDIPDA